MFDFTPIIIGMKTKKAEFTGVIEYFFDKFNAENGCYGQTIINHLSDY